MTSGAHCPVPPSSAHVWANCAYSPIMSALFPELTTTEDQADGEATHELAARMVRAAARGNLGFPTETETVGSSAGNGIIVSDEMYQAAHLYAETVADVMRATGRFVPRVEERVSLSMIHPAMFGTPDAWLFDDSACHLHLFDFKYGHRLVEVFENFQLVLYFVGVLHLLAQGRPGLLDQMLSVTFYVVQPRAWHRDGPVRKWTVNAAALRPLVNMLTSAAEQAFQPEPPCKVGAWCGDCRGRHACEPLQRAAYAAYDYTQSPMVAQLPPDALGLEVMHMRRFVAIAEARLKGLEAEAEALLKQGTRVPFSALEVGKGRETWNVPVSQVVALGEVYNIDLRKPSVITPTQARKAGIASDVVAAFTHVPTRGIKIVPDDGAQAKKVFGYDASK